MLKTKKLHNTLKPGQWKTRIFSEELGKGWKPSRVCLVGLRNRDYPLMQVDQEAFGERVPRDKQGFFFETPYVARGLPILWVTQGLVLYIWPIPIHSWKMRITVYKEIEDESADTIGGGEADDRSAGAGDSVVAGSSTAEITLQRHEYREHPASSD